MSSSAYTVHLKHSVQRALERWPAPVRAALVAAIDGLAENPRPPDTKKLKGSANRYRLRVAHRYRLVWEINDKERTVHVLLAGHRRDVYRGL